jgi:NAD-dependent deacetylase
MSESAIPAALVERLRTARHVAVLTGAGISAESGIPTFRDPMTGLWANFKPEELATPAAFRANPRLVWDWYAWRREQVANVQPNPGHRALAAIAAQVPRFTLLTQNVDGLHVAAGSRNVIELHGNIRRVKCFDHDHPAATWDETGDLPPKCARCGSLLRPDVVWFGERLPTTALNSAAEAVQTCDLFLAVGTSLQVEPAASLPYVALEHGATVAVVSLDVPDRADGKLYQINGKAGEVLPAWVRAAWPALPDSLV